MEKKRTSNNGKKRNSFTLEKLLIYFFLQIKFAFRKEPLQIHNQQSLVKTDVKIQKQFQLKKYS